MKWRKVTSKEKNQSFLKKTVAEDRIKREHMETYFHGKSAYILYL